MPMADAYCSSAAPTTIGGRIRGDRNSAAIAFPPGTRVLVRTSATGTPRAIAVTVELTARTALSRRDST